MYAIVEIGGKQHKVEKGSEIIVSHVEGNTGDKLSFDRVLMVNDGGKVSIGKPTVAKANVNATITDHMQGDKVIVFKKKRRKGYRVKNGYRDSLTRLTIDNISK